MKDFFAGKSLSIYFFDDAVIGGGLVRCDAERLVQPHRIPGLPEKCSGCGCVPASCEPEINQLTVLIDRPPKITPSTIDAQVRLVDMPIQPPPTPMFEGSLSNFRPKFLNPSVDCGCIDFDATFG